MTGPDDRGVTGAGDRGALRVFADAEETARAAAGRFAEIASLSAAGAGRFTVALSGGSTPRRVYELLAAEPLSGRVNWADTHVFFGDERCVPPEHPESNYRMASDALLARVPLRPESVHRMRGEGDCAANARLYEDEMRASFPGAEWPVLDLVMLGLGEDGHTASLFPGSEALEEGAAWAVCVWAARLRAYRITLTAAAINRARHVLFVVTGRGKAQVLREVLEGERDPARLPAQLIRPVAGTLEWFADAGAASALRRGPDEA